MQVDSISLDNTIKNNNVIIYMYVSKWLKQLQILVRAT